MGLRFSTDPRAWVAPVAAWLWITPYIACLVARAALALGAPRAMFRWLDFSTITLIAVLYYVLIGVGVLMALAVPAEREQGRWEALRLTPLTADELALGWLAGRAGPALLALVSAGILWVLFRPHYVLLLADLSPVRLSRSELQAVVAAAISQTALVATMGLLSGVCLAQRWLAILATLCLTSLLALEAVRLSFRDPWQPVLWQHTCACVGMTALGYLAVRWVLRRPGV